ncbi:hypothetical protein D3C83_93960 [compost metagenome]
MLQERDDLVLRQAGVEQRGALALGEAGLAALAVEQASAVLAVAHADGEVAVVTLAVVGAVAVLAAEGTQVVHGRVAHSLKEDCSGVVMPLPLV